MDTLLAAKVLWAKADWPTKPAVVAGSAAEGAAVEEEAALEDDVEEAGMDAGTALGSRVTSPILPLCPALTAAAA